MNYIITLIDKNTKELDLSYLQGFIHQNQMFWVNNPTLQFFKTQTMSSSKNLFFGKSKKSVWCLPSIHRIPLEYEDSPSLREQSIFIFLKHQKIYTINCVHKDLPWRCRAFRPSRFGRVAGFFSSHFHSTRITTVKIRKPANPPTRLGIAY